MFGRSMHQHQCLVVSSKVLEAKNHDRTCLVMSDRTHPASGHSTFPLCAAYVIIRHIDRTQALSVRSVFSPASGHETETARPLLPLTGHAGPTETSVRSLPVTSVFSV